LTREIVNSVSIPVVASGGCGKPEDMIAVFKKNWCWSCFSCFHISLWDTFSWSCKKTNQGKWNSSEDI